LAGPVRALAVRDTELREPAEQRALVREVGAGPCLLHLHGVDADARRHLACDARTFERVLRAERAECVELQQRERRAVADVIAPEPPSTSFRGRWLTLRQSGY
jgi:hypothetical protein